MAIRNVQIPYYQPKIPISGGGGVIDLSSKENETKRLLAEVIGEALGSIGKERQGRLIKMPDGSWALIDNEGNVLKRIPTPPESGVKVLEEIARISKAGGDISEGEVPQEVLDALIGPKRKQLMGIAGLEEFEEEPGRPAVPEVPGKKRSRLGIDLLAKDIPAVPAVPAVPPKMGFRKKVESKTRPAKPKEYPDAKWSEEHQCWTIIKNGRLMGVK